MAFDLKKESDVKEYLEKLGIEYRFGCYSEKRPEGETFNFPSIDFIVVYCVILANFCVPFSVCHLLGDYLESIKKDFDKASKVYRSTCDDYGYAKSCLKYGNYSFLGKGKASDRGDPVKAYSYYEKGCNLNDADSCLHSGLILVSRALPAKIERDVPKGLAFLTKSCEMNNSTACFYLSGMFISGVTKASIPATPATSTKAEPVADKDGYLVAKDMEKAFNYAYKACELKNMYACANLSQMYARGDGTPKSEENAAKFKKLAVEMQDEVKKQQTQLEFQQGL
jgi:cytochrome c oxidase assembly factor 7